MTLPATINVSLDLSTGATFGIPFTLNDTKNGILGTNILADQASYIVDLTPQTLKIAIRRGRNIARDTYEAGNVTVRIDDPNSYFNPQNINSPYYGQLTPLKKLRISATYGATIYFLGSFYTTEYRYSYPTNQETGFVDIVGADAFRLFNLASVLSITGAAAGQDTGARIGKILDAMSFPSSMRALDSGKTNCLVDPATLRTGLEALKNAEFSEQGAFYINPQGTAVFKNRTNTINSGNGSPIEFNQTTGIPYTKLIFAFDDKLIINTVTMNKNGSAGYTYFDTSSIVKYFPHANNFTDLVMQNDTDVQNAAAIYVNTRKETTLRIDQMDVDLLDPTVPTATILGMDYFTNVKITNVQPDSSTIIKNLQIQGVAWDITADSMKASFTTLERITDGFIVGSSTYGVLGQDIIAY